MAENKRVYTITISGLTESYEGVKSLREALSGLTDTVINVSNEEQKTSETRKSTASSTDALAKAQEKLNNYDRAYQEELAKVNAELSANKKEINDALKLQQAQDVVDAKQLDTYAQKQQYLSALNTLIRNHSTATEEDTQAIDRMVQESAQLQAELKATDAQMQIYVRNVGNYQGAADTMIDSHKGIKQELKDIKTEMAEMLANGVSKTDEGYLKLAERAGQLKDALGDANQDIANFASDTQGLSNAINLASSAVNAYQLYNSTMELFGEGNEEASESMKKMMAVMTVLNSLQQVQNSLLENGSATGRLYNKAVEMIQSALGLKKTAVEADTAATEANSVANEANVVSQEANAAANEANAVSEGVGTAAKEANTVATGTNSGALGTNTTALGANATASKGAATATNTMSVAQKAGAVASKTLSMAMKAIPLMAIISLVMALIQNWESIWNWFKKTFPILDTLSKKFDKFGGFMNAIKTGAKALCAAIVNWIINPFKTFAEVIGKILEGDFKGAWNAAVEGVARQTKGTLDAFNNELEKGMAEGQEEMTRKQAEEEDKRLTHHANMITKQKNKDGTYRKDYIKAEQDMYDNRKKMYKKDSDEYNKVLEEEAAFHQKVEDAKTAATEKGAKERAAAAKKASAEAKKASDEAKKAAEELEKARQEAIKKTDKDIEESEKLADATDAKKTKQRDEAHKRQISEYAKYLRMYLDDYGKMQTAAEITARKAEDVREIMASAITDGTEFEVQMMKKLLDELEAELGYFAYTMGKDIDHMYGSLGQIDYFLAERHEYAIDQIARGAQKIKDNYKKQYDALEADIVKMQSLLPKLVGDELKETNAAIKEAQEEQKRLIEKSKVELGQYRLEGLEIHIPVDVDFKNIAKRFSELKERLEDEGKDVPFTLTQIVDASVGVRNALKDIYDEAQEGDNVTETFSQLAEVLGLAKGETEDELNTFKEFVDLAASGKPFREIEEDLNAFVNMGALDISKFGNYTQDAFDVIKTVTDETEKVILDSYKTFISQQDKVINYNKKVISNFRESAKGLKLEPVMQDDVLSGILKGQIIDLDKTSERYSKLMKSYNEYASVLREGSKERIEYETAWQLKLMASYDNVRELKKLYGENSDEYKNAVRDYELLTKEKEKADAEYAMEYEKVTQQIEDLSKKQADLMYDYIKSITDRLASITKTFQDNVMNPIFDGLSDLFALQLEEAEDALDEITELYDKAVEAREESADRMKEINEELRDDDGQNKEALQQRLAEEEVLLVQREEAERTLEKEKKKRQYEADLAEARQRKFELRQKLAEGIVNTALGATAALKYGFPLGPVFAAIITAMGALQTAIIAKQIGNVKMPQKYAAGGKVGEDGISRSHKQGGHRIEGTNIEVEGQEWVINRKSSDKYDGLLRAINDDNAGMIRRQIEIIRERRIVHTSPINKFADGGRINTLAATNAVRENNEIAALTELVKQIDFEPVVSVVDINKTQKRLVRVKEFAGSVS